MTDLIVKSPVKDAVEDHPVAADFYEALNDEVDELLSEAAERSETNNRKTVEPRDL
jgi:histone H3/H4